MAAVDTLLGPTMNLSLDSDNAQFSSESSGGIWRVLPFDSNHYIGACYDKKGRMWQASKHETTFQIKRTKVLDARKAEVLSITKIHNKMFALGSADSTISFWSHNGDFIDSIKDRYPTGIYSIEAIDEGKRLVSGSCQKPKNHEGEWDHNVKVWNVDKRKFEYSMAGHSGGISSVVDLGNKRVATSSGDKTVRIWDLNKKTSTGIFKDHSDYVYGLCKLSNNNLVSASKDRSIKVLDANTEKVIATLVHADGVSHTSTVFDVGSYSDYLVASASRDGYVKLWDIRQDAPHISTLDPSDGFVYSAKITPDGTKVIAGTSGTKIKKKSSAHLVAWELNSLKE